MDRSLTFAFLDSWHTDPESGSGTTVAIDDLEAGLRALGHRVVHPDGGGTGAGAGDRARAGGGRSILRRLLYNLRAPRNIPEEADLVVGFDVDGFLLPFLSSRAAEGAPRVVALKGVAADEARFERGRARLHLRLLAALEGASARRAGLVVTPSAYSARRVADVYGVPPSRIAVVPEGIDLSVWDGIGGRAGPLPPRPTILSVARQYPRKNTLTLLEALPRVVARVPDVRLRIVGDGPLLATLRRRAEHLGLEGSVEVTGALSRDQVRAAYFEAHCFCLPSLQEGFGIVFLEAMAAGLPVVAARAGAVPEVVRDGEEAILVDGTDPDALAAALVAVLTDPARAARMATAGRARVRAFDRRTSTLRFLEAVRPLLGGRAEGPVPATAPANPATALPDPASPPPAPAPCESSS